MRVWADANRPVYHVQIDSPREVTVKADRFGLAEDDVFYFGNALGDTGDAGSAAASEAPRTALVLGGEVGVAPSLVVEGGHRFRMRPRDKERARL